jgi:hypothetical protein
MRADLLAVVVQMFHAQLMSPGDVDERALDHTAAAKHFLPAIRARQFQVEDGFATPAARHPLRGERGDPGGRGDDIAHHPIDRALGSKAEGVLAAVLDHLRGKHLGCDRAVVDCEDAQPAARQDLTPTATRPARIRRGSSSSPMKLASASTSFSAERLGAPAGNRYLGMPIGQGELSRGFEVPI